MSENTRPSMELSLFSYDDCQPSTTEEMAMEFSQVVLNKQIGDFPAGTKFDFAYISFISSALVLANKNDQDNCFDLSLQVGQSVDITETGLSRNDDEGKCGCGDSHCGN